MAEIRIKNVPAELKAMIKAEAKRLGMDERGVLLMRIWGNNAGSSSAPDRGPLSTPKGDAKTPNRTPKFIPPTEQEVNALIVAEGYHFSAREFVAHYGRQRWKLGNGRPMGDWKQTMVTWEENWKGKHQGDGQGAAVGRQEYDTSGNEALVKAIKEGKGW